MTIFTKKKVVEEIQSDQLVRVASTYFPDVELSDSYIWDNVRAAEAEIEQDLRVFLEPVVVLPESVKQSEKDALDAAGTRWIEAPGYDWEPEFFRGNAWGYLIARHSPVISVDYFKFIYPISDATVFEVPTSWIRIDKKYGHIRILPSGTLLSAPLNSYIMSVVGGGRTVPHVLMLKYTAGIKDVRKDYPNLVKVIKKLAVLKIIEDEFQPSSQSISADGLTQSMSVDTSKYEENIEKTLKKLREEIHGVRMMAV